MYIFTTVALSGVNWPTGSVLTFSLWRVVGSYVGSSPIGGIDCNSCAVEVIGFSFFNLYLPISKTFKKFTQPYNWLSLARFEWVGFPLVAYLLVNNRRNSYL